MKKFIFAILALLLATIAYSATGDKPNQMVIPFRNVSSSIKPAGCVNGEMRQNNQYIFTCTTTAKWRRSTKGLSF